MAQPIPGPWREKVLCILKAGNDRQIEWTRRALERWKTDTISAWNYEAYDAMTAALSTEGIEGYETTSKSGQLATYEFLFRFKNEHMYGKIALKTNGTQILILSAHRAERQTLDPQ